VDPDPGPSHGTCVVRSSGRASGCGPRLALRRAFRRNSCCAGTLARWRRRAKPCVDPDPGPSHGTRIASDHGHGPGSTSEAFVPPNPAKWLIASKKTFDLSTPLSKQPACFVQATSCRARNARTQQRKQHKHAAARAGRESGKGCGRTGATRASLGTIGHLLGSQPASALPVLLLPRGCRLVAVLAVRGLGVRDTSYGTKSAHVDGGVRVHRLRSQDAPSQREPWPLGR